MVLAFVDDVDILALKLPLVKLCDRIDVIMGGSLLFGDFLDRVLDRELLTVAFFAIDSESGSACVSSVWACSQLASDASLVLEVSSLRAFEATSRS